MRLSDNRSVIANLPGRVGILQKESEDALIARIKAGLVFDDERNAQRFGPCLDDGNCLRVAPMRDEDGPETKALHESRMPSRFSAPEPD